jgi:hypothetical protein
MEWSRKAKAELEAEAAAAKARQRDQQASEAEADAAEAEASGDEKRSKRPDDSEKLAIEKAEAADLELESPLLTADRDPLAMPQRTLPTYATGNPKHQAQRNVTDPDSHILKSGDGWMQG